MPRPGFRAAITDKGLDYCELARLRTKIGK